MNGETKDLGSYRLSRRELIQAGVFLFGGLAIWRGSSHTPSTFALQEFRPVLVDDMETYGYDLPLTDPELLMLYQQLNDEKKEVRPDTYYATMFVTQSTHENFVSKRQETFQSFLMRHAHGLNTMLEQAANSSRVSLRRLIIVEDDATKYPYYFGGFPSLEDSDGGWNFTNNYDPEESGSYDRSIGIDNGLYHEWGHAILHLNDYYRLDFSRNEQLSDSLRDLPPEWIFYFASRRQDQIHNDVMALNAPFFGAYSHYRLEERIREGRVHEKNMPHEFPYRLSEKYQFELGERLGNSDVFIYGSEGIFAKKRLVFHQHYHLSPDGTFEMTREQLPFRRYREDYIEAENGILFMDVKTPAGERLFRWMDIIDFSIPYWLGFTQLTVMQMQLASARDRQFNFNWKIHYSTK